MPKNRQRCNELQGQVTMLAMPALLPHWINKLHRLVLDHIAGKSSDVVKVI